MKSTGYENVTCIINVTIFVKPSQFSVVMRRLYQADKSLCEIRHMAGGEFGSYLLLRYTPLSPVVIHSIVKGQMTMHFDDSAVMSYSYIEFAHAPRYPNDSD